VPSQPPPPPNLVCFPDRAYAQLDSKRDGVAKAKVEHLRTHFKNARETACSLKGLDVGKAKKFLEDVIDHKRCVTMNRFAGSTGRTAQAKNEGSTTGKGRWPQKTCRYVLSLLQNAVANAKAREMDVDKCYISTINVNQAMKGRRRTNRAHGRVNPYLSSPCHIELVLSERVEGVAKAADGNKAKLSRKQCARMLRTGYKPIGWRA